MARQGDDLRVFPESRETEAAVVVQGAVNAPCAVPYRAGEDVDYYIEQAGGYAPDADKARAWVRYPDGSADTVAVRLYFRFVPKPRAGSVVTVPFRKRNFGRGIRSLE